MKGAARIVWKDVLSEVRGPERVATLVTFSAAVLVTFHFAMPLSSQARAEASAGFLWVTIVFAALLELRRSWDAERRDTTLDALRASPVEPAALFAAKLVSSFGVLVALEAVLVTLAALFFTGRLSAVPVALAVAAAGTLGTVAWGTLFAAAASGTRSGDIVLAAILVPLVVPQTIACVKLLGHYMAGMPLEDPSTAFVLLAGFDLLALGTGVLLFEYALGE